MFKDFDINPFKKMKPPSDNSFDTDQEIKLLNEEIDLYIYRLDKVDKWYNRPWVGITGGFLGTIILLNTIDYTLPD